MFAHDIIVAKKRVIFWAGISTLYLWILDVPQFWQLCNKGISSFWYDWQTLRWRHCFSPLNYLIQHSSSYVPGCSWILVVADNVRYYEIELRRKNGCWMACKGLFVAWQFQEQTLIERKEVWGTIRENKSAWIFYFRGRWSVMLYEKG